MYYELFSNATVSAAFEAAIVKDASSGRINNEFRQALSDAYGITIDAKPLNALKAINDFLVLEKAPKLIKGKGARAAAPAVALALHALALLLVEAGKIKNLPMLAGLPAWADPAMLAEKRAAAAEKRAEKRASATSVTATSVTATSDTFKAAIAAIKNKDFTEAQLQELRDLLQGHEGHESLRVTAKMAKTA